MALGVAWLRRKQYIRQCTNVKNKNGKRKKDNKMGYKMQFDIHSWPGLVDWTVTFVIYVVCTQKGRRADAGY